MEFSGTYESGTKYGTGRDSTNYIASVSKDGDRVKVRYDFRAPRHGKSNSAVMSLEMSLSRNESLQLAASIIALSHHPTAHDSAAIWMPPESMPSVTKNNWSDTLKISANCYKNEIEIQNKSHLHIGCIQFEIVYEVRSDDNDPEEHTTEMHILADLVPGATKTIGVARRDMPDQHRANFTSIISAAAIDVTGRPF